jgi:hypothetical protein
MEDIGLQEQAQILGPIDLETLVVIVELEYRLMRELVADELGAGEGEHALRAFASANEVSVAVRDVLTDLSHL